MRPCPPSVEPLAPPGPATVLEPVPAVPVVARGPRISRRSDNEKGAFQAETESHGQNESAYARFILQTRKDPLMFLQLCRLDDPAFAHELVGKPMDAGKLADFEKQVLEARHSAKNLARDRGELQKQVKELERRLTAATDKAQAFPSLHDFES